MKQTLLFLSLAGLACAASPEEFKTSAGPVKITPIQHATMMIEAGGRVIHVDPAQGKLAGLPKADLILITDIHGDHMDEGMLRQVKKDSTEIIGPPAVAQELSSEKVTVMKNGETRMVGPWTIQAVPMYNMKRGPGPGQLYHDKGRGNGYILTYGGLRIYIAGDTEGIPEMRALKNIDVAFIPMNLPYTMPPEEAAEAVKAFKPKVVYPYHYQGSDLAVFEAALKGSGVEVRIRDWYPK
jgi:L-ascorbate metabolism protein UlaG (beta-lactamase superfamily)